MTKPKQLANQSMAQQEAFVHQQSQDTGNIIFTNHVLKHMKQRAITAGSVTEVLRQDRMKRHAEQNIKTGALECRLDRCIGNRQIGVVVAINDDNPNLIVVTAMD